jgi:glycosyltransferase involved in cell wall biosynthesis
LKILAADAGLACYDAGSQRDPVKICTAAVGEASRLGLDRYVHWYPAMPQAELFARYREVDAVLFPSLHDSSGNVVVEALSFALPVICLDLGGPAEIVTDASGCVVRTHGLDEQGVIARMADAIERLARDGALYERLSAGALARAGELDWGRQMARIKALALGCVLSVRIGDADAAAASSE